MNKQTTTEAQITNSDTIRAMCKRKPKDVELIQNYMCPHDIITADDAGKSCCRGCGKQISK